jgi:hypothetical protein
MDFVDKKSDFEEIVRLILSNIKGSYIYNP